MHATKQNENRKPVKKLKPEQALAMLESAVSYCQQAGIKIGAVNGDDGTLGLFVQNAYYILTRHGTRAAFRLGKLSARHYQEIDKFNMLAHQAESNIGTRENVPS